MPIKTKIAFFSGMLSGMLLILVILGLSIVITKRNARTIQPGMHQGLNFPTAHAAFEKTHGTLDADWTVLSINGDTLRMADLRGKVVFLNLWATWCGPCIREMPGIEALQKNLNDDRIVFLLVTDESIGLVRDALETFWDGRKLDGMPLFSAQSKRPRDIKQNTLPTTYIIDKKGKVRFVERGSEEWDVPAAVTYLKALADEPV